MKILFKTPSSGIKSVAMIGLLSGSLLSISNAATIFATEGFESGLGDWSIGSWGTVGASNDTGLYDFNGGTPTNGPTGQDAINFATTGEGAFRLENGFASLNSNVFDASAGGATESMTISLDLKGYRTQSTRRGFIEYSKDNGTNWLRVAMFSSATGSGTVTLTEGGSLSRTGSLSTSNLTQDNGNGAGVAYSGEAFGSQSTFRFVYDSKNDDRSQFIDNLEVTTTAPVPEPSSAALLGLAGLALIMRRRK